MRTFTFTYFTEDDHVYGYSFNITRDRAQDVANRIHTEEGVKVYFMEGYFE